MSYEELYREYTLLKEQNKLLSEYHVSYDNLIAQIEELGKHESESITIINDLRKQLQDKVDQIEQLKRLIYGRKSERFVPLTGHPDQLSLFEDNNTIEASTVTSQKEIITYEREKKKSAHAGRRLLENCGHLPLEEQTIEVDHSEDAIKIGECVTEQLGYKPGKLYRLRITRPKYKDVQTGQIICAPPVSQAIPKCEATHSLLAFCNVSKFVDHLPEHRLLSIFKREKVIMPSSTINNWTHKIAELMGPVAKYIQSQILAQAFIQMDESTIQAMSGKKNSTHLGYMWVINSPPEDMVYFEYHPGRGHDIPDIMLQLYIGILQTDGYSAYEALVKLNPNIIHACCMAHARRYFEQARVGPHKEIAEHILKLIQRLYTIERHCRESNYDAQQRLKEREASALIMNEMKSYIEHTGILLTPKSLIAKAITYMLKRWKPLTEFTRNGIIEIDNNLIENAIRPLALGRKNYLFAGNNEAARNIANFYTIYGTCKKQDINPYDYTIWFLDNIPHTTINHIDTVSPMAYKKYLVNK